MQFDQLGSIENPQERSHHILAVAVTLIARWRRSSYAPLFVVLLLWALLFLLAIALIASAERR